MTLNIFKLWKKDLSDLYDSCMYDTKATETQIKIKALELLEHELIDLRDDPSYSIEETIKRLNLFEESNWYIKRARTICKFHTYGMLKDDQNTNREYIPTHISNSSKLRLFALAWLIILTIYVITLLF